jgi:hypothetical protein
MKDIKVFEIELGKTPAVTDILEGDRETVGDGFIKELHDMRDENYYTFNRSYMQDNPWFIDEYIGARTMYDLSLGHFKNKIFFSPEIDKVMVYQTPCKSKMAMFFVGDFELDKDNMVSMSNLHISSKHNKYKDFILDHGANEVYKTGRHPSFIHVSMAGDYTPEFMGDFKKRKENGVTKFYEHVHRE